MHSVSSSNPTYTAACRQHPIAIIAHRPTLHRFVARSDSIRAAKAEARIGRRHLCRFSLSSSWSVFASPFEVPLSRHYEKNRTYETKPLQSVTLCLPRVGPALAAPPPWLVRTFDGHDTVNANDRIPGRRRTRCSSGRNRSPGSGRPAIDGSGARPRTLRCPGRPSVSRAARRQPTRPVADGESSPTMPGPGAVRYAWWQTASRLAVCPSSGWWIAR